ncbi:hypothetical protein [Flavobacterium covae]|uniref:hypothetical protein n=1 Tax=Flavobacterium covae TaxID=2906076 RepID=UPI0033975506
MGKVQGKYLFILIISSFILNSCKKENNISTEIKSNDLSISNLEKNNMNKVLKNQLEGGASFEYPYEYSEEDLDVTIPILKGILKKNDYKIIDSNLFREKIKQFFARVIDPNLNTRYLFVNFFESCNRNLNFKRNNPDNNGFFILKDEFFITNFYALPEIIDYQKEFPNSNQIEENPIRVKDEVEGVEIEISRWKEIKDLSSKRNRNIKLTIERNKYLFNDNNESFVWLQKNDKYFLESLVKTFGYVKDKQLLEFVFDNQKIIKNSNIEEINKLLWHKTCDEKLVFHKETLDIINEKENKKEYFNFLNDEYLRYIDKSELPISEKAEIIANILNFIALNTNDYDPFSNMGFFAQNFDGGRKTEGKYSKEFIKHNFYNLKDFKKQWEESKIDGDGVAYPGNIE